MKSCYQNMIMAEIYLRVSNQRYHLPMRYDVSGTIWTIKASNLLKASEVTTHLFSKFIKSYVVSCLAKISFCLIV